MGGALKEKGVLASHTLNDFVANDDTTNSKQLNVRGCSLSHDQPLAFATQL